MGERGKKTFIHFKSYKGFVSKEDHDLLHEAIMGDSNPVDPYGMSYIDYTRASFLKREAVDNMAKTLDVGLVDAVAVSMSYAMANLPELKEFRTGLGNGTVGELKSDSLAVAVAFAISKINSVKEYWTGVKDGKIQPAHLAGVAAAPNETIKEE